MSFTDAERRAWHKQRALADKARRPKQELVVAECIHCGAAFGFGGGVVTDEAALCDVCLDGD